jgi:hypothetical protein
MIRLDPAGLERYLLTDPVAHLCAAAPLVPELTSQRWLNQSAPKRLVFDALYADCLEAGAGLSLLDVGGGLSALTPVLARARRYGLIDPLFHETPENMEEIHRASGGFLHVDSDWIDADVGDWDVIIANDLFPNVDQRLRLFLDWAVARAKEVRLSLTFHNTPRWFTMRREGLEERLTVLAFDGAQTRAALEPFAARISGWAPQLFDGDDGSVFSNGRQVVICKIQGDLWR